MELRNSTRDFAKMNGRNIVFLVYILLIYLVINVNVAYGETTTNPPASDGSGQPNTTSAVPNTTTTVTTTAPTPSPTTTTSTSTKTTSTTTTTTTTAPSPSSATTESTETAVANTTTSSTTATTTPKAETTNTTTIAPPASSSQSTESPTTQGPSTTQSTPTTTIAPAATGTSTQSTVPTSIASNSTSPPSTTTMSGTHPNTTTTTTNTTVNQSGTTTGKSTTASPSNIPTGSTQTTSPPSTTLITGNTTSTLSTTTVSATTPAPSSTTSGNDSLTSSNSPTTVTQSSVSTPHDNTSVLAETSSAASQPSITPSSPVSTSTSSDGATPTGAPDSNTTTPLPPSNTSTNTAPTSATATPGSTPAAGGENTHSTQQTTPDPCKSFACVNGTCSVSNGTATCTCTPGYTGNNCATNIDDCSSSPCMYGGTCRDGINNYTCQCAAGYNGQNCSNNIDDCKNNPCMNGGSCRDGINNYTCQCAAGYNGQNCSNNIDECHSNPCQYGSTCTDGINMYTCTCAAGFNGTNCENDINECQSNPCQNGGTCNDGTNMYTCTCAAGFNGTNCGNNIDECIGVDCKHGGTCVDGINNFTCNCAAEWEGRHCEIDVDECGRETHQCHKNAKCTNTVGGYNCTCIAGFTGDGFTCEDIDECTNETLCQNGATCFNTPGSYLCYCTEYWNGTRCETDIDECTSSPCANNAACINTKEGYNCTCIEGYRGDGHEKCFQKTLITVTSSTWRSGDDNVFGPVTLPEVIYYFGKPYNTFYVSMNGYITLGNYLNQRYPPKSSSAWAIFDFPIIAPLWSDIVTEGQNTGVSFSIATDNQTLEQIGNATKTSRPSVSIIATWQRAVPYPFDQNKEHEAANFQVIVSKVGVETYLMFNYDQEFFTWKSTSDKLVSVGYSSNDHTGVLKFGANDFTEANMQGSNDVNGSWIFSVTLSTPTWVTDSLCLTAVSNSSTVATIASARSYIDACPCSIQQIQRDRRFKFDKKKYTNKEYVSRFGRGMDVRQRCHYSASGSLLRGYPDGGYIETEKIKTVYKMCCTDLSRCDLFYKINPSDTCESYRPPSWSSSWGDPHIKTLDGANYTFNGRGEFTLMKIDEQDTMIHVQVRTDLADESNQDATVFVGIAAQVGDAENGDKVEILLDRTTQSCSIYTNGVLNVTTMPTKNVNIVLNGMEISSDPDDDKLINIAFRAGMFILIKPSGILDIVTSVPKDGVFQGNTTGLLGNNNGNNDDDFRPRNDSNNPMDKDSSEEKLYTFGITWRVNEDESLFNYNVSGGSYSFYNNESIKPRVFISDKFTGEDIYSYINDTCGYGNIDITSCGENLACVVDTVATCNETFGLASKATEETVAAEKETLDHMPPNINQPDPLYIGYSQHHFVEFTFKFLVDVQTNISAEAYTCKNCTSFSLNVSEALRVSPAFLNITAKDNIDATSEYRPDIYYCGCMEDSQCDYSLIVEDGPVVGSEGKFFRARCNCSEGTEGDYCQLEMDRCAGTPCYANVTCNNTSVSNNPCGPCPTGFEGDGSRCFDANECYLGTSKCSQICENNEGSYRCDCSKGYKLGADGYTCNDIDECELMEATCKEGNEYCENTIGSYVCMCNPGYLNDTISGCVKGKASYGGILVFETFVHDKELLKTEIKQFLKEAYNKTGIVIMYIEVSVEEISAATRKRRETRQRKWNAHFVLHTQQEYSSKKVHSVLNTRLNGLPSTDDDYVSISETFPILVSASDSIVYTDEQGGICNVKGKTECDPISTTCHSENGTAFCRCKQPFFEGWANPYTSCKDVDECLRKDEICQGALNCTNMPGSYTCQCPAGYIYDGQAACVDMCAPNPCKNGGQCIHGELQGQYLCKCDDMWTGPKCEDDNAEAKKLKIIAIAVGASIGAICLLLLLALFGMYRRHKNKYGGYNRRPLSSMDFDSSFGLTGSNIRTKDFPIDDDTDTGFSLPRPKYNQNGYEMNENGGASIDGAANSESGKMEEPKKPLTQTTKESTENGQENPSFLHSENLEAARRTSKRESKNAYDYF